MVFFYLRPLLFLLVSRNMSKKIHFLGNKPLSSLLESSSLCSVHFALYLPPVNEICITFQRTPGLCQLLWSTLSVYPNERLQGSPKIRLYLCKSFQKSPGLCLCQSFQRYSGLYLSQSSLLVNPGFCHVTFSEKLCPGLCQTPQVDPGLWVSQTL